MVRSIHKTDPPSPQSAVKSPGGLLPGLLLLRRRPLDERHEPARGPRSGEPRASLSPPRLARPAAPRARAPPVNPSDPVLRSSLGLIRDPPQPAARRAPRGRLRATQAPRDTGAVARALPSRPVPPRPAQPQACPRQGAFRPAQRPSLKPTRARPRAARASAPTDPLVCIPRELSKLLSLVTPSRARASGLER
jgi:hypothetical protein